MFTLNSNLFFSRHKEYNRLSISHQLQASWLPLSTSTWPPVLTIAQQTYCTIADLVILLSSHSHVGRVAGLKSTAPVQRQPIQFEWVVWHCGRCRALNVSVMHSMGQCRIKVSRLLPLYRKHSHCVVWMGTEPLNWQCTYHAGKQGVLFNHGPAISTSSFSLLLWHYGPDYS